MITRVIGSPPFGNITYTDRMSISPGKQASSSWRTERRNMKVIESNTSRSKIVYRRGMKLGSVASEIRETNIVEYDNNDVGPAFECTRLPIGVHPLLRFY
jgi:hypothetical protein